MLPRGGLHPSHRPARTGWARPSTQPNYQSRLYSAGTSAISYSIVPGPVGQEGEQLGAQAPALPVVHDGDGDLGGVRVVGVPDVAGDAHAAPVGGAQRADCLVVVVVDLGE